MPSPNEFAVNDLLTEDEYLDALHKLPTENQYLEDTDPNKFIAKMGAEAILELLRRIDSTASPTSCATAPIATVP